MHLRLVRLVSLVSLCAASAAVVFANPLPRSAPEAQGVSSPALLDFLNEGEAKIEALHSVMIVRRGQVIAEGWWAPYAAEEPHQMFSLSKSFTSTAVGLAIAEGKFTVDDPVLKFFPEEAPASPSANLRAMRVRDLLTMATGQHNEDIQNFSFTTDESVVKRFLALPVAHKPGTFFVYNTPATYMLSAIVQKTTGQPVLEFLRPRLFEPLGIANPTWEASKQGVSMGGFGLNVRTEDIAKFGLLYLQRGQWNGKQLVPAAWTETATSRWMSNGSNPASDWEQGYGFQFWRCRNGAFRGDGAHGQFCVVLPEQETVIAITAGTRDLQGVLNVIWAKLLPALQGREALPANASAAGALQAKLRGLTIKTAAGATEMPAAAKALAGRRYVFARNPLAIESVSLQPSAENPKATELVVTTAGDEQRVKFDGRETWQKGELKGGPAAGLVAVNGAWTSDDTFTLGLVRYRTPLTLRYRLQFAGDEVTLETQPSIGSPIPALKGRRE